MQQPDEIVRSLQTLLDDDPSLADVLEKSLRSAAERAAKELDADVYDVLDWPRDLPQYYDYLSRFVRWIPQQTDAPAWKTSAPQERYAKEVSDRLAHFFWLVDQKADVSQAAIAENSPKFRGWLTEFAREWGSFLDTTASFDDDILQSFLREAPEYTIEESLIDGRPNTPSGWLTFNQFFARELNAGLRPISAPADNRVVTSPADCSFRHCYDIDADSNIPATAVKGRHYGNITQLIDGSRFADTFAGGTFVHYMLPPSAYHRFHVPVAGGTVEEAFVISGQVYMQVDLEDHQLKARDSAHTGYEFFQNRGVLTVDTSTSGNGDLASLP